MRKIREVLRLHALGLPQRQIARSCSAGQSTVSDYLKAAAAASLSFDQVAGWDEARLIEALFGKAPPAPKRNRLPGPTGVGKTWLARAFAHKACRDGYTALFLKSSELFRNLATARADGSHSKLLYQLGRVDLLIADDCSMAPLTEAERRDFLEIRDARYQARSTLLTSQLPVARWHAQIGDPTLADSIPDRLVHNAHRIELSGESMRRKRATKTARETS